MGAWWLTVIGTLITGFCYSLKKYSQWKGYQLGPRTTNYNDWIASYFRTLLGLLLVRSFIVEWSIIPSESLMPTLLVGDRVITDKAAYGIRLPILGHVLIPLNQPQRGDIVVFRSPVALSTGLMSRLIGLPGDRIQYRDRKLSINGKPVSQIELRRISNLKEVDHVEYWILYEENLEGHRYQIYKQDDSKQSFEDLQGLDHPIDVVVPKGHYFVMGDHRDNSIDSRTWEFLPDHCLLGKVKRIYLSRNKPTIWWKPHHWLRWSRLGMKVR